MKLKGEDTSVFQILRSTKSDFRLESFEFEINLVIGVSRIMIETWQAARPLHGLLADVAAGREMFTKFQNVKFFAIDFGRDALILNQFSRESTKCFKDYIITLDCFSINILSLVTESANITQNHIRKRALQDIFQALQEHHFYRQLVF